LFVQLRYLAASASATAADFAYWAKHNDRCRERGGLDHVIVGM
jgi:hypothetical protein